MKILITGATGFIGRSLCARLLREGHQLTITMRSSSHLPADWTLPCRTLVWDPAKEECPESLDDLDALINLQGETISKRWTAAHRERLRASRVRATQGLGAALAKRKTRLPCLINASAIGYYPYNEDGDRAGGRSTEAMFTEHTPPGDHFLASICREWEAAAFSVPADRHVIFRFGLVLGPNGGALEKMLPLFRAGLGGRLGSGCQWMSWIHRDDLLRMLVSAVADDSWQGLYNAVAPEAITNSDFTRSLAAAVRRPALFPAPAFALRLLLGAMSEMLLKGQRVRPLRLEERGFTWRYPRLAEALTDIVNLRLETQQFIPRSIDEVFAFFGDPHNLQRITPAHLHFQIQKVSDTILRPGTTIDYQLRLHGIPFRWRTCIKEWKPGQSFVDIQEKGPYDLWHHTHRFHAVPGGTLMCDEVRYQVPLGWLGERVASGFVRKEVLGIFAYRRQMIARIFN